MASAHKFAMCSDSSDDEARRTDGGGRGRRSIRSSRSVCSSRPASSSVRKSSPSHYECVLCSVQQPEGKLKKWNGGFFFIGDCYNGLRSHNRACTKEGLQAAIELMRTKTEMFRVAVKGFCKTASGRRDPCAHSHSKTMVRAYSQTKDYTDRRTIKGRVKLTRKRYRGWAKTNLGQDSVSADESFDRHLDEQSSDMCDSDNEPRVAMKLNEVEQEVKGKSSGDVVEKEKDNSPSQALAPSTTHANS